MAKFNISKYKNLNNNIAKSVDELIDIGLALPIILGEVQSKMLIEYNVSPIEEKQFCSYVCKRIYEKYISEIECVCEKHIDWTKLPGVQKRIWTLLVRCYYDMTSFDDTVVMVAQSIMTEFNIESKYLMWIGLYIQDAADMVFYEDTDAGMEEELYGGIDGNEYTYRGLDLTTNKFAYSPCEKGVVNENNEIISPFDPDTVELFMDMYDDMTWDVMPDDHRKMIVETYNIPDYMIRAFSETWRGIPIFTHDILITTVYDANDECKGDIVLTHILMGDEILTLVLQNDNNVIIQEDDIQFSMNIGSLHDHPEMMEIYEAALSAAIMNNQK